MARRILTAQAGFRSSGLQLDDRIDIQWKHVMDDRDDWSHEIRIFGPTWEITRLGEKFRPLNPYGTIEDEPDRRWILGALENNGGLTPQPYVARVNEIQRGNQNEPDVVKIEMMTGSDAANFLRAEKNADQLNFVKNNWFGILVVACVAYWWFF